MIFEISKQQQIIIFLFKKFVQELLSKSVHHIAPVGNLLLINSFVHGILTRYVKLRVAHAPGMPGTLSLAAHFKENCYSAIPACITARASRTCRDACRGCLPAVAGKTFPAFPAHAHPQFYVSGKRPMAIWVAYMTQREFS